MGPDIGAIMDELTDNEIWARFDAYKKLNQIAQLKLLLQKRRTLPAGCGSKEPCGIVCWRRINGEVTYTGPTEMRAAGSGNPRFQPGEHHKQCAVCKEREQNETEIRNLKHDLGYR